MLFVNIAVRNLRRHWIRSMLSIIGIVIGVFAIASLGIMGNSINLLVANVITDVGDTLVITPHVAVSTDIAGDPRSIVEASLSPETVSRIERVSGGNEVIPVLQGTAELTLGDEGGDVRVIGMHVDDIPILLTIAEGQMLRQNRPGVLVGSFLANEFDIRAGSRIELDGEGVRVAGVLEERGFAADINPDFGIVVSDGYYGDRFGDSDAYAMVIIKVRDIGQIDAVKEAVDDQLNRREDTVDIFDSRDMLAMYEDFYDQITVFLLAIGGVSLIIAAINILNVMYISVTERTHEIGILRSIGTLRSEILRTFIYEAAVLGIAGSFVGGLFSAVGGYAISVYAIQAFTAGTTFGENITVFDATSVAYVVFAVSFGVGISILSGFYPAWIASKLTPIEALRHD
ncbi:MAG TPA: ABC transporter permease [Methanoculleus sp.]|nr:ABC transporter permease [Methanoculleus sp.]